jgi:hypothetical protein
MFTITKVAWLNGGRVGVVQVRDHTMNINKYYIHGAGDLELTTEDFDATKAARWGSRLKEEIALAILNEYGTSIEINYTL